MSPWVRFLDLTFRRRPASLQSETGLGEGILGELFSGDQTLAEQRP